MWKKVSIFDVSMEEMVEMCENVYYRIVRDLEVDENKSWDLEDFENVFEMSVEEGMEIGRRIDEEIEVLERVLKEVRKNREIVKKIVEEKE